MNNKDEFMVMPAGGMKYISGEAYEDEISLIKLVKILLRRKFLFLGTLASVLALALGWIMLSKPVYESRAVLLIGQIAPMGQFETVQTLIQRLREEYKVGDQSEGARSYPIVVKVAMADKGTTNAVEILTQGYSASDAQAYLRQVVDKLLREHKRLYELGTTQQQRLLDSLEKRHNEIQAALSEARKRMLSSHSDAAASGLLTLEMDQLFRQLSEVDQAMINQRMAMSELQSRETSVIRQPTLPKHAVKPKPLLYLLVAGMLGCILGGFMVFVAEFFVRFSTSEP